MRPPADPAASTAPESAGPPALSGGDLRSRRARLVASGGFHVALSVLLLLLDLVTGRFLQFPILFVLPVALAAWHQGPRLAWTLAILLPLGRLAIAAGVDFTGPLPYLAANAVTRMAVLGFIAHLVARNASQTRQLRARVESLAKICAWSRTIEYEGEWLSFEDYLLRRFNIHTSHGISPAEAAKVMARFQAGDPHA